MVAAPTVSVHTQLRPTSSNAGFTGLLPRHHGPSPPTQDSIPSKTARSIGRAPARKLPFKDPRGQCSSGAGRHRHSLPRYGTDPADRSPAAFRGNLHRAKEKFVASGAIGKINHLDAVWHSNSSGPLPTESAVKPPDLDWVRSFGPVRVRQLQRSLPIQRLNFDTERLEMMPL